MAIKHEIVSVPFRGFYISNKNEVILRSDSSRKFPSPFGVSIFPMFHRRCRLDTEKSFRPLSGFLYFQSNADIITVMPLTVSVPFRGFYISNKITRKEAINLAVEFPSPFGVSIFPMRKRKNGKQGIHFTFPSPFGVSKFPMIWQLLKCDIRRVSVPFRGFYISN